MRRDGETRVRFDGAGGLGIATRAGREAKTTHKKTGDPACANGWAFSSDHLPGGSRPDHATDITKIERWFAEAGADVFACAHTCRPVLQKFENGLVANNGAAGLGNFRDDSRGLVTRVACTDVESALGAPLYSADLGTARVEAVPLAFDLSAALAAFDAVWAPGSAAAVSYRERLVHGDSGWSRAAADRGGVACPHLHALVEKQESYLPRIIAELEAHGEKRSHWAWCGAVSLTTPSTRCLLDGVEADASIVHANHRLTSTQVGVPDGYGWQQRAASEDEALVAGRGA